MSTRCPQCHKLIDYFICREIYAESIIRREKLIITISCPLCGALVGTQVAPSQRQNRDGTFGNALSMT